MLRLSLAAAGALSPSRRRRRSRIYMAYHRFWQLYKKSPSFGAVASEFGWFDAAFEVENQANSCAHKLARWGGNEVVDIEV